MTKRMPNSLSPPLSQSRSKPSPTRGSPKKEGENGVIDLFLEYDISQNCKHIFHPFNAGRCGSYSNLDNYKGLQSGQIAPLAGLFGRGSGVIWPICYYEVGNLCYGRVSFRVYNDDYFARIYLGWLRVGLGFERFDSDLVWAKLTFIRDHLWNRFLCAVYSIMLSHYLLCKNC